MPSAIVALCPAEPVAVAGEGIGACFRQRVPKPPLDLAAEGGNSHPFHGVFETSMLAIRAVAEIALHRHDLFRDVHGLIRGAETDDVAGSGESIRLAVCHAHAAAGDHVIANDTSAFLDGDEAEIL